LNVIANDALLDLGNLLGQSLSGLGSLLQMPYGCGEQNMLNFAPDVYILKYFQATGQSAGSIAGDALSFINTGRIQQAIYMCCSL
jgi:CD109 antigen